MADVVAFVADVMATGSTVYIVCCIIFIHLFYFTSFFIVFILHLFGFYFILSSELLSRTSSHTCGRWHLPTFLFRMDC